MRKGFHSNSKATSKCVNVSNSLHTLSLLNSSVSPKVSCAGSLGGVVVLKMMESSTRWGLEESNQVMEALPSDGLNAGV
jgi:hypothetical protein